MQTDYLRYFIDVATLGSMNAAAKKNFMTPQGVSRSITALESELGCELFRRDSNRVTLTRYGKTLLENAREVINHENEMRRTVLELHTERMQKRTQHFTFYSSPIFFDTQLFFPTAGLGTAHYGKVQFLQRSTPHVVDLLVEASRITQPEIVITGGLGLFDLFEGENERALRMLADAGYEYHPFMHTHDYVLVPAFSPLAEEEALSKATIGSYPLAVAASGGMERAVSRHIGADSIYVSSGDSNYRSHLCRMGEALTFVPGLSLAFGVPEGTVAVPMQEPYTIEIGFAGRASAFREGMLADIINRLRTFYAQNQRDDAYTLLDGSRTSSLFVRNGASEADADASFQPTTF